MAIGTPSNLANLPAYDANSLNDLRRLAKGNSPESIKAAAQQFEALFMQQVLKAMRDATPKEGMFDSEQTRTFQSMLDQQLAQVLAARGSTGLAALLEKQMGGGKSAPNATAKAAAGSDEAAASSTAAPKTRFGRDTLRGAAMQILGSEGNANATPRDQTGEFVNALWPHARKAAAATGIPAHFMIAQAALETGWGKSQMQTAEGGNSHNMFGVKAGRDWTGPVVEKATTEYVNGVAQKTTARFRAYASYDEAFSDYARLLKDNPRYASVVGTQDPSTFARGLQQAGYATDPMYADKLQRIISGPALRSRLMG